MFSLSKKQYYVIISTFLLVIFLTAVNLRVSLRKGRDAQRKLDVRNISRLLENFREENSYFPESMDGKIRGCETGQIDEFGDPIFRACNWGNDNFAGVPLPSDPHSNLGVSYYYLSSGTHYQIYAALEGTTEAEYDPRIITRNLYCGNKICDFGLGYKETPLDKSIEEYEKDIEKVNGDL